MSFLDGKKVLVTGATGLVGVNLLQRLLETGAEIRATVHKRPAVVIGPRITYMPCDLTSGDDCRRAVSGMEYVFHCAASTSGAAVIAGNPLAHVTPNVVMNAQLLDAAYAARVKKFLWLSSSTGYPPTGTRPVREEEMMDGDPYDKYYGVGWMKRYTEILCRMYAQKLKPPMLTLVLRPTNIYGEYDDFRFETSHVFAALIRRVVERHDPLEVWGTGDDVRDLIYVQDFVTAMLLVMERAKEHTTLNIGSGGGISVKDLLALMLEIDGFEQTRVVFDPSKPTMIPARLVDITRAAQQIGFHPATGIRDGIKNTLCWYRAHPVL